MRSIRRLLPALALVLLSVPAFGAVRTWYVDPDGNDATGVGSIGLPFKTIGHAVSVAASGDRIRVLPGYYTECVNASGKALAIIATAIEAKEPSNRLTVIDGTGICGGNSCAERRSVACYGAAGEYCQGYCNNLVCSVTQTQRCLVDTDCPENETCTGTVETGVCTNDGAVSCTRDTCHIPDGETVGTCVTYTSVKCSDDSDCANVGCDFGDCERIQGTCSVSGSWCAASGDCPSGETCDTLGWAPVLDLGDGSSLTGFTIFGGGLSGVHLKGSGEISQNQILSNRATSANGGGILVDPAPASPPASCWGNTAIACADDARCKVCRDETSVTCSVSQDCVVAQAGTLCVELGPCLAATEVLVRDNAIRYNAADAGGAGDGGGGLLLRAATAAGSGTRLVASGNEMTGNVAAGDGGALLAIAGGDGRFNARMLDNSLASNEGRNGGAVAVKATLLGDAARADVTLLGNAIDGNKASESGGGAFVVLDVAGTARLTARDNAARANTAVADGGGMLLSATGDGPGLLRLDAIGNQASGNQAGGSGGGLGLSLSAGPASTDAGILTASGNTLIGNDATVGGGGLRAALVSSGSAAAAQMAVETNTIRKNSAGSFGGGAVLVTDSEGTAGATARFSRNLVAENAAVNTNSEDGEDATGGGLFLYLRGGAGRASVTADFNTIASNSNDLGAAAIEIESDSASGGSARVAVSNSILANNAGVGVGGPAKRDGGKLMAAGPRDLGVVVTYTDVWGNTGADYERTLDGELTHDASDIAAAPILVNDFSLALCSNAIDAADPSAEYSLEPQPNGQRANLGHLGGTAAATPTLPDPNGDRLIDGKDLLRIASSFASDRVVAPERYFSPADLDGDGVVDGNDLAYVSAFFGFACP